MKKEWRDYLYKQIPNEIVNTIPKDFMRYADLNKKHVWMREFYTTLFVELARFESGFNPKATYKESFKDSKGKNVISTGLFQVSVESLRGYGVKVTQEELFDPYKNIDAMLAIAKKWIVSDGVISSDKAPWKGMSRYFSPFRDAKKKEAIAKETMKLFVAQKTGVENKMAKKIGLVVGHTKKAQGADSKILGTEYVWNSDLASMVKKEVELNGHSCLIEFRDIGGMVGAYKRLMEKKPKVICELHFNSFNGKATGVETLHTDNYDKVGLAEQKLAGAMSFAMSVALNLPLRHRNGIKEISKGERGWYNVAQTLSVASILIESGFGDNPVDATSMKNNKDKLAKAIANCLINYVEGII